MSNYRTPEQAIEDWFKNSPDWPYPVEGIDIDREIAAFTADKYDYLDTMLRIEMAKFIERNKTN